LREDSSREPDIQNDELDETFEKSAYKLGAGKDWTIPFTAHQRANGTRFSPIETSEITRCNSTPSELANKCGNDYGDCITPRDAYDRLL